MAATLLSLPRSDKDFHGLEYLISSAHVPIYEVFVMSFEKPMVFFILLHGPMSSIYFFKLIIESFAFSSTIFRQLFFGR